MAAHLVYRGKEIELSESAAELVIGRHRDCDIQLSDKAASRQHTKLLRDGEGWLVQDLGSSNGTKINKKRITKHKLQDGDLITIGESLLKYLEPVYERTSSSPDATIVMAPPKPRPTVDTGPIDDVAAKEYEASDLVGVKLAGYRIGEIITTQSVGTVYTANQLRLSRQVALKILSKDVICCKPGLAERILDAARVTGRISHQGIVQIHECGFDDGLLWYSMEYVEGDILGRRLQQDGQVDLELVLLIADRLASALAEVHRLNMAHGDIRPDNVLISKAGLVKLVDMGVATLLQEARQLIDGGDVRGNPLYISPECANGAEPDARSDIYSLGCMLFHLATGKPPFPGHLAKDIIAAHHNDPIPHLSDVVPGLPSKLDDLLQGMLAKNPEWRFQTIAECQEYLRDIRQVLGEDKPAAAPVKNPTPKPAARRRPAAESTPARNNHVRKAKQKSSMQAVILLVVVLGGAMIAWPIVSNMRNAGKPPGNGNTGPDHGGTTTTTAHTHTTTGRSSGTSAGSTTAPRRDPPPDDNHAAAWKSLKETVAAAAADKQWSRAEFALHSFIGKAKERGDGQLQTVAESQLRQLYDDAGRWYQHTVNKLPSKSADNLSTRLDTIGDLRNRVSSEQRSDIESRYQQTLQEMGNELAAIRRDLVAMIETGDAKGAKAVAKERCTQLAGTPFEDLERQLRNQAEEVANLPWQEDWPTTRQQLSQAKGEAALGAAAALLLLNERQQAVNLLFQDQSLSSSLAKRRDQLLVSQTVILDFDAPGDLAHLEIAHGDAFARDGSVTGPAGAAARVRCKVGIGGSAWETAMRLTVDDHADTAHAEVSLVAPNSEVGAVSVRLEGDEVKLILDQGEQNSIKSMPRPQGAFNIRLRCSGGQLTAIIGNQTLADGVPIRLPSASSVRFETLGMHWQIDQLQVIGGG